MFLAILKFIFGFVVGGAITGYLSSFLDNGGGPDGMSGAFLMLALALVGAIGGGVLAVIYF